MKKIFFTVIILLFAGCTQPQPPEWFINTPTDNNQYFFASNEGYSKQNALKKALNDIASKINVQISSDFVINKGIHNKKTYNDIYQQINTQIQNIDFNNYNILKTKKEGDKYYILIKVNKQNLIRNLKIKINMDLKQINFNNNKAILKVKNAYKILKKLKKIKSRVFILESLGTDISEYIKTIEIIQKKAQYIIQNTKFRVISNQFKTASKEAIATYLKLSHKTKNSIKISIKTDKLILFNNYIIKGRAVILLDKPYTVTFLGNSASNYKEAYIFAKMEYKKRVLNLLKQIF